MKTFAHEAQQLVAGALGIMAGAVLPLFVGLRATFMLALLLLLWATAVAVSAAIGDR